MDDEELIIVGSGYGHKSHQPFVEITVEGYRVQLSPENAQEIGNNLIQAAEAALSDAFFVEYMSDVIGTDKGAAVILGEFRIWRGARRDEIDD